MKLQNLVEQQPVLLSSGGPQCQLELKDWQAYLMSLLKAWRMAEFDTGSSLIDRWTLGFVFSNSIFLQTNNNNDQGVNCPVGPYMSQRKTGSIFMKVTSKVSLAVHMRPAVADIYTS